VCRHAGPLPSCSSRVLRSLRGRAVSPYWFDDSSLTFAAEASPAVGLRGLPARPGQPAVVRSRGVSSHGLRSAPGYGPDRTASPLTARSHARIAAGPTLSGFLAPTAHEATGSDLRRVCLARLRCAFRLSQPLDAFFLPKPCCPVSCSDARGISPPEVSPSGPPGTSLDAPAPPGLPSRRRRRRRPREIHLPRLRSAFARSGEPARASLRRLR
jgi:hypothetical protein